MIYIAHRGNVNKRIPERENSIAYIEEAISMGYDVEIDLRFVDGRLMLGHDTGEYYVSEDWIHINRAKLWIHAKDVESLHWASLRGYRVFFHDRDNYTLTSFGVIWAYPGHKLTDLAVGVVPEMMFPDISTKSDEEIGLALSDAVSGAFGVCSDYVEQIKKASDNPDDIISKMFGDKPGLDLFAE